MRNAQTLRQANQDRIHAGSARTVALAKVALERYQWPHPYFGVLSDRITYPDLSLAEIAAKRGETKDVYAGLLRRALGRA